MGCIEGVEGLFCCGMVFFFGLVGWLVGFDLCEYFICGVVVDLCYYVFLEGVGVDGIGY